MSEDMGAEPPKSFLKRLFSFCGPARSDREELFRESSGNPIRSSPSSELNQQVQHSTGKVGPAHHRKVDRDEKLGQLEKNSLRIMNEAETLASAAHKLNQKWQKRKWYHI